MCPTCDKEFQTAYRKKEYCSTRCQVARNNRRYNEKYPPIKQSPVNEGLGWYKWRATPTEELSDEDFVAIQIIWHSFDYAPLYIFPDTRDVRTIHDSLFSQEMFHEWVVYTIIFQSHLLWRYEMIVQIPGLVKSGFSAAVSEVPDNTSGFGSVRGGYEMSDMKECLSECSRFQDEVVRLRHRRVKLERDKAEGSSRYANHIYDQVHRNLLESIDRWSELFWGGVRKAVLCPQKGAHC